ncbi:hypothetical protein CRYUN_Cryun21dG0116400 [Craigia yunnanensis]
MEIAVKTLWLGLNPKIISYKQVDYVFFPNLSCKRPRFPPQTRYRALKSQGRERHVCLHTTHAVSSVVEDVGVSSQFDDFTVTTTSTQESRELKIRVEVSGAKTRAIFNDVFDKMVAAAQPIPGFRRVKGGTILFLMDKYFFLVFQMYLHVARGSFHQTFTRLHLVRMEEHLIPRDILLEVLGASRVYKQVITKVINSTVAAYVEKERLAVGKDLRVEQSFEDLEEIFEPDVKFSFDAIIQLQETN